MMVVCLLKFTLYVQNFCLFFFLPRAHDSPSSKLSKLFKYELCHQNQLVNHFPFYFIVIIQCLLIYVSSVHFCIISSPFNLR